MPRHIKTRDYNLLLLIGGATKSGIQTDIPKQASKMACRGNKKTMTAPKKKSVRSFDWTRPALHGDELFEICVDEHNNIVEVFLVDEEGDAWTFNHSSFNEEEMASIKEMANGD